MPWAGLIKIDPLISLRMSDVHPDIIHFLDLPPTSPERRTCGTPNHIPQLRILSSKPRSLNPPLIQSNNHLILFHSIHTHVCGHLSLGPEMLMTHKDARGLSEVACLPVDVLWSCTRTPRLRGQPWLIWFGERFEHSAGPLLIRFILLPGVK